jgi:hypothetical protein
VNNLLPVFIELPASLYRSAACIPQAKADIAKGCLLPCTHPKFNYRHWYHVAAWWAAELNAGEQFETYAALVLSSDDMQDLYAHTNLKYACLVQNDTDLIVANRLCAALSMYKVMPYLLAALFCLFALGTVVRVLWTIACSVMFSVFVLYATAFY